MVGSLEDQLGCNLELPRREGRADLSVSAVADVGIGIVKVRLVEDVEGFGPEVEHGALAEELEALVQAHVGLREGSTANGVARRVAEGVRAGRHSNASLIQIIDWTARTCAGALRSGKHQGTNNIWPIGVKTRHGEVVVHVVIEIRRQAAGQRGDVGELPATGKGLKEALAVTEDRQVPHNAGRAVKRLIVSGGAIVPANIGEVDTRVIAAGGFQMTGGIVKAAAVIKRSEYIDSPAVALFELHLECVVVRTARTESDFDGREVGDRTPRLQRWASRRSRTYRR